MGICYEKKEQISGECELEKQKAFMNISQAIFFLFLSSLLYSQPALEEYKKTQKVEPLIKAIQSASEEQTIELISSIPHPIPAGDFIQIHGLLVSKGYHQVVLNHFLKGREKKYAPQYYQSLFILNKHKEIFSFILHGIKESSQLELHFQSLKRLLNQVPEKKSLQYYEQIAEILTSPADRELFEAYFYLYLKKYPKALSLFLKSPFNPNSGLSRYFYSHPASIAKAFYQQAEYASFLIFIDFAKLDQVEMNKLKHKAITYLHFHLPTHLELTSLTNQVMLKMLFYENEYQSVFSAYRHLSTLEVVHSLLALNKKELLIEKCKEANLIASIPVYLSLLEGNLLKLKDALIKYQGKNEAIYAFKNLIMDLEEPSPYFIPIMRQVLTFNKYLGTYLDENAKEINGKLRDFAVISYLRQCYHTGRAKALESYFRLHYAELSSDFVKEQALYWYGRSLEVVKPQEAKSIYEKLLLKNPDTYYRHAIVQSLDKSSL